jgi:hypothetical protein
MRPEGGRPERPVRTTTEVPTTLPLGKQLAEELPMEPAQGEEKPRPNRPFAGQRPGGFGGPRPQIAQFMAEQNGPRPNRPMMGDGPRPEMIAQFLAGQNGQNGPRPVGQMGGQRPNRPFAGGFAGLNNGPRPMGGRPRPTEMPVELATEQ